MAKSTYADALGNNSEASALASLTIDTVALTLSTTLPSTTLTKLAGTPGNSAGETITLTLTFDGEVSGLTSGTNSTIFKVAGTGVSATWGGTAGTNKRTLTYTVTAGQNGLATIDEATLKTALVNGISDAAGKAFSYTANSGVIPNIDATPLPTINTTATSAATDTDTAEPSVSTLASDDMPETDTHLGAGDFGKVLVQANDPLYSTEAAYMNVYMGSTLSGPGQTESTRKAHVTGMSESSNEMTFADQILVGDPVLPEDANNDGVALQVDASNPLVAADLAGNSLVQPASTDYQIVTSNGGIDTLPISELTTGAEANTGLATDIVNDTGTAYLVNGDLIPVDDISFAGLTGFADSEFNFLALTSGDVNLAKPLSPAVLDPGIEILWSVDARGNLSHDTVHSFTVL